MLINIKRELNDRKKVLDEVQKEYSTEKDKAEKEIVKLKEDLMAEKNKNDDMRLKPK